MKKLNKQLMNKHGGEIIPFKRLTMPYKLSIAWYMSMDGAAWELPFNSFYLDDNKLKKSFIKNIDMFDKEYGKEKFGVMNIPVDVCKQLVIKIMEEGEYLGDGLNEKLPFKYEFKAYHKWYMSGCGVEKHTKKNAWPCILSDFDDEFFQDGWHRFHRYIELKISSIPCVCYV